MRSEPGDGGVAFTLCVVASQPPLKYCELIRSKNTPNLSLTWPAGSSIFGTPESSPVNKLSLIFNNSKLSVGPIRLLLYDR